MWAGALALLAGCGSAPSADNQAVGPVAQAQPAANVSAPLPEPAPAAPAAIDDEQAILAAAADYAQSQPPLAIVDDPDGDASNAASARYFDVIDCGEGYRDAEIKDTPGSARERLERRIALLGGSLTAAGYSANVVDAPLAAYAARERGRLPGSTGGAPGAVDTSDESPDEISLGRLATALDDRRARLQPDQPPIRAQGECGAAETPTLFRSQPAGARIWLITKFGFDVCRARKLDPWNGDACNRWSEIDSGRPIFLSGNYMYRARWPDGVEDRGAKRIDPDEGELDQPQPVWVRRP